MGEVSYVKDCAERDNARNHPSVLGCAFSEYEQFRDSAVDYLDSRRINVNVMMLQARILGDFDNVMEWCPAAVLTAMLLKMEDAKYHDPELVSSLMPVYLESLGRLSDDEFSEWPLKGLYFEVVKMHPDQWAPSVATPPSIDIVICFCGKEHQPGIGYDTTLEDLGWLEEVCVDGVCVPTTRLLVYEKCGSFPEVHQLLRDRFESFFKEIEIIEVDEQVRADDCTAYLQHIVHFFQYVSSLNCCLISHSCFAR